MAPVKTSSQMNPIGETPQPHYDVIIVGRGLAGSLLALRLSELGDKIKWLLIGPEWGAGSQTWSFHSSDLRPEVYSWINPWIDHKWQRYEVHFPGLKRSLPLEYNTLRSASFYQKLAKKIDPAKVLDLKVTKLADRFVETEDGQQISARVIIDATGFKSDLVDDDCAWQKFVGHEVYCPQGHNISEPIIMKADIPQIDGYRFLYLLPYSEHHLLIEDTYYSMSKRLDVDAVNERIECALRDLGIREYQLVDSERGTLPIPLSPSREEASNGIQIGMAGGYFHPTSGYSFAYAASLAWDLGNYLSPHSGDVDVLQLRTWLKGYMQPWLKDRAFLMGLNRMLFLACVPSQRWRILRQFYRRRLWLIQRFYRGQLGWKGRFRMVACVPQVPLWQGTKAFFGKNKHDIDDSKNGAKALLTQN